MATPSVPTANATAYMGGTLEAKTIAMFTAPRTNNGHRLISCPGVGIASLRLCHRVDRTLSPERKALRSGSLSVSLLRMRSYRTTDAARLSPLSPRAAIASAEITRTRLKTNLLSPPKYGSTYPRRWTIRQVRKRPRQRMGTCRGAVDKFCQALLMIIRAVEDVLAPAFIRDERGHVCMAVAEALLNLPIHLSRRSVGLLDD